MPDHSHRHSHRPRRIAAHVPATADHRFLLRPTAAAATLVSLLMATLAATGPAPAWAQAGAATATTAAAPVAFDIPAGPLEPALTAFAKASGVLLAYTLAFDHRFNDDWSAQVQYIGKRTVIPSLRAAA